MFLHYLEKQNQQNIAFLTTGIIAYSKNTQNTHFVHIFYRFS